MLLCGYYGVLVVSNALLGVNQGALVASRVLWWLLGCFGGFQDALVVSRVLW